MQDETQLSALGLLSPPLQNKHPHPILLLNLSLADTDLVGIALLVELPSREPISPWDSLGAGHRVRNCLSQGFFPGLDHYYCYRCWASRGKHVFGPHTKGFG